MAAGPETGKEAPDFALPSDGGGETRLSDLRGRRVVLYFYPKDDTPGCAKEACAFRDAYGEFARRGVEIVGVSKDDVARHDKFKAKHGLPFPLLSDARGGVCEDWGTWVEKTMYGRKFMGIERSTFLIDEEGRLRAEWRRVRVPGHVEKVLAAVDGL